MDYFQEKNGFECKLILKKITLYSSVKSRYAFNLIDAQLQVCGAPAQYDVLAVCSQLVHGQVYDGAIIYKLYVLMYIQFSCSLSSSDYR